MFLIEYLVCELTNQLQSLMGETKEEDRQNFIDSLNHLREQIGDFRCQVPVIATLITSTSEATTTKSENEPQNIARAKSTVNFNFTSPAQEYEEVCK